jgi:hypothetical protein
MLADRTPIKKLKQFFHLQYIAEVDFCSNSFHPMGFEEKNHSQLLIGISISLNAVFLPLIDLLGQFLYKKKYSFLKI